MNFWQRYFVRASKLDLIALLPVVAITLIFSKCLVNPDNALLVRDMSSLTLPRIKVLHDALLYYQQLPLWNPFVLGGVPYCGDPGHACFYPLNLVFLVFPARYLAYSVSWYLFIHVVLIYWGALKFYELYEPKRPLAILLASAFAMSGTVFSSLYVIGITVAHMAWVWFGYFWVKSLRDNKTIYLYLSSFFLALPLLGAEPQTSLLMTLFLAPFIIVIENKYTKNALLKYLALVLLMGMISLIQVLPSVDLLEQTVRKVGTDGLGERMRWSLHPWRLLELFVPNLYSTDPVYPDATPAALLNGIGKMPFIYAIFVGIYFIPSLVYGLAAILFRRIGNAKKRQNWIVSIIISGVFLLLAMGKYAPLNIDAIFLRAIPFWNGFRFPERYFWISCFFGSFACLWITLESSAFLYIGAILSLCATLSFWFGNSTEWSLFATIASGCFFGLYFYKSYFVTWRNFFLVFAGVLGLAIPANQIFWVSSLSQMYLEGKKALGDGGQYDSYLAPLAIDQAKNGRIFVLGEGAFDKELAKKWFPEKNLTQQLVANSWHRLAFNTSLMYSQPNSMGYVPFLSSRQFRFWQAVAPEQPRRALGIKGTQTLIVPSSEGNFHQIKLSEYVPFFSLPTKIFGELDEESVLKRMANNSDWSPETAVLVGESEQYPVIPLDWNFKRQDFNSFEAEITAKSEWEGKRWLIINQSFDKHWKFEVEGKSIDAKQINFWATGIKIDYTKTIVLKAHYSESNFLWGLLGVFLWIISLLVLTFRKFFNVKDDLSRGTKF